MAKKDNKPKEKQAEEKKKGPLPIRFLKWVVKTIFKIFIFILVALVAGIILGAITFFLLYNFFPIKTATFCISNESTVSPITCTNNADCTSRVTEVMQGQEAGSEGMGLLEGLFTGVFQEVISCNKDGFCEIKEISGLENMMSNEKVVCKEGETEKSIKITPKTVIPPQKLKEIIMGALESGKLNIPSFS